mgnify:FL=1
MNVKIIDSESSNRIKLLKNLNKAIDSLKMHVTPTIEDDERSIKNYNITNTPALIINNKVISQGKVLTEKEIVKFLKVLS